MVSFRDAGSSSSGMPTAPAPLVWCTYPISDLFTQSYRVLFCVDMLFISSQPGQSPTATALGGALLFVSIALATTAVFGFSTTVAHDSNVFALALILQYGLYAFMLCVLACSFRPQPKHIDLRPFYSVWCQVIFVPRMILQHFSLAGPLSDLGASSAVVPASCDASTGLCVNPCQGMVVGFKYYRGSGETLLPVLWSSNAASMAPTIENGNSWIAEAPNMKGTQNEDLIRILWWSYILLGPLYQCARVLGESSPKETRNRVFRRLRQDYRPRKLWQYRRRRQCFIYSLIWLRHLWKFLVVMSMELRLLQSVVSLAAKAGKYVYRRYRKKKPTTSSTFDELVVLEVNPSVERLKIAKGLATLWYFCGLGFYLVFPSWAVYMTVKAELNVRNWVPQYASFSDSTQWMAWALFGGFAGFYVIRYLIHELLSSISKGHRDGNNRKRIFIPDPSVTDEGPEWIAMMEKTLQNNDLSWPRYLELRISLEWYEFRYWWRDPVQASLEKKPKKSDDPWDWDETYRKGGGRGEIQEWTSFPNATSIGSVSSRKLWTAPEPKPTMVEYSYEEQEASSQRLLTKPWV